MAENPQAAPPATSDPNVTPDGVLHLPGKPVIHSSGLPLAQIQAWNAQEVAAGRMTQAQALAIENGDSAAPVAPAPSVPAVDPAAPGAAPALNIGAGVEAHVMWELAHGRLSQEQADAMLGRGAAAPVQDAAPDPADPVVAHLTAEGFPPARPQDFQLPQYLGQNERMTPALQKADETMRGWLADARLTREIGNSLAKHVAEISDKQATASPAEREIYARSERAKLDRMWGDKAEERIALAQQLVSELEAKRPGLVKVLEDSGSGNSSYLIAQLSMHADRIVSRKKP